MVLRKIKRYMPTHTRILFFNSFILPFFDYCSPIWAKSNKHVNRLYVLQKRAAKLILEVKHKTNTKWVFKTLNWLPIKLRTEYHEAILLYKILNGLAPPYFEKHVQYVSDSHKYETRSSQANKLLIKNKAGANNYYRKMLKFSGCTVFNSLTKSTRESQSLTSFKKQSKIELMARFLN